MTVQIKDSVAMTTDTYTVVTDDESIRRFFGLPGTIRPSSNKAREMFGPNALLVPKCYFDETEMPTPSDDWLMAHS